MKSFTQHHPPTPRAGPPPPTGAPRSTRLLPSVLAVLGALALIPSVAASASNAQAPAVISIGPGVVSGSIPTTLGGGRAFVDVLAWPTGSTPRVGSTVRPLVMGKAWLHAGDSFSFHLPVTAAVAALAAPNSGWVNLRITAAGATSAVTATTAVRLSQGQWRTAPQGSARWFASPAASPTGGAASPSGGASPDLDRYVLCGYTTISTAANTAIVGELHTWANESGWFVYGKEADSNIQIKVSIDGSTWSGDGSLYISNANKSEIQVNVGAYFENHVLSDFSAAKEKLNPPPPTYSCMPGEYAYQIAATQWNSGDAVGAFTGGLDGSCPTAVTTTSSGYTPGSSYTRYENAAGGYGLGFSVLGVWLGTQSGFSTYTKEHWSFGSQYGHYWLCGRTTTPPYAPFVFAGPNS